MTNDIRKLPPCRDTDAMVARAMGWRGAGPYSGVWFPNERAGWPIDLPAFTANTPWGWAAMRECWEWLLCRGWLPTLDYSRRFQGKSYSASAVHYEYQRLAVGGDSLPHALALLVLLVAQAEESNGR